MARSGADGEAGKTSGRRRWLEVAVAAAVLLALSETLWLWQTWPVRELLHLPSFGGLLR